MAAIKMLSYFLEVISILFVYSYFNYFYCELGEKSKVTYNWGPQKKQSRKKGSMKQKVWETLLYTIIRIAFLIYYGKSDPGHALLLLLSVTTGFA